MLATEDLKQVRDLVAESLKAQLKTVTDRVDKLDPLIQGKQHMYFICLHSGLYLPGDYVKEWGRKYGIGLGGDARSECLDSEYNTRPALTGIRTLQDIMHPCKVSGAPLDVIFLSRPAPKAMLLITAREDRDGRKRGILMREKQLKNPNNRIAALTAIAAKEGLVYQEEVV